MKSIKLSPISKKYYKDHHHEHHHHIHYDHSDHAYHDKHHHKSNYHDDSDTIDTDSNRPILEWHRVMKKLERLRVTNGHSMESLFANLKKPDTLIIPVKQFAINLSEYSNNTITYNEALLLGNVCDKKGSNLISYKDLLRCHKETSHIISIQSLLDDHPLFPSWLTHRNDFQVYFKEWVSENGAPSEFLVEATLRLKSDERKPSDVQVLSKWLRLNKILVNLSQSRLLDVCKRFHLIDCPSGEAVIRQNEPGDAFYVVLTGQLNVTIDDKLVNIMVSGSSFGEKALENDAPRSATVTAIVPCKLMILHAAEYKHLALCAQVKLNEDTTKFITKHCSPFRHFSYPKLYSMVRLMSRSYFKVDELIMTQGSAVTGLFIIKKGNVVLMKRIDVEAATVEAAVVNVQSNETLDSFREYSENLDHLYLPSTSSTSSLKKSKSALFSMKSNDYVAAKALSKPTEDHSKVTVIVKKLSIGNIFGDDCLRGDVYTYTAVALDKVEVIVVNLKELRLNFKENSPSFKSLLAETNDLHENDFNLLIRYNLSLQREMAYNHVKADIVGPVYHKRIPARDDIFESRSKSTRELQRRQREHLNALYASSPKSFYI